MPRPHSRRRRPGRRPRRLFSRPPRRRRRRRAFALLTLAVLAGAAAAAGALLGADRGSSPAATAAAPTPAAADPPRGVRDDPGDAATRQTEARDSKAARKPERRAGPRIRWRDSKAIGTHEAGGLRRGVLLPAQGPGWVSWDPILKRRPNREWRRWGTDRLVRKTLRVLRQFRRDHPAAPRVAVGDLSRPRGGDFGPQFGSIGHATHQNGLDVDVYYPRKDRRLRPPDSPDQVDLALAQDLVDRFVAAGAEKLFVGPSLGLRGPPEVVVPLVNHDNHLHFRLPLD